MCLWPDHEQSAHEGEDSKLVELVELQRTIDQQKNELRYRLPKEHYTTIPGLVVGSGWRTPGGAAVKHISVLLLRMTI